MVKEYFLNSWLKTEMFHTVMHGVLSTIWSGCSLLIRNPTVHYHTCKSTYPCSTFKISLVLLWPCGIFTHILPLVRVSLVVAIEEFAMSFLSGACKEISLSS